MLRSACVLLVLTFVTGAAVAQTPYISTYAGGGSLSGAASNGQPATSAALVFPRALVMDAGGNLLIVDQNDCRIRKVSPAGIITTIAGTGAPGYSGDGGPATQATLNRPSSVALDTSGNILFSDEDNEVIRKITVSTGIITTIVGNGARGYNGDGQDALQASLSDPIGITVDPSNNIYFAVEIDHRIRKITASTNKISTVAGTGSAGFSGDGGQATAAQLQFPRGVCLDHNGNLLITDANNQRIRRVNLSTGIITTFAGSGSGTSSGDGGQALSAGFNFPIDLAIDYASGALYVSDSSGCRVRRIGTDGIITTVAGTGTPGFSGDGGPAASAGISFPRGIAVDPAGNVYEAEDGRVRKIHPNFPPQASDITISGTPRVGQVLTGSYSYSDPDGDAEGTSTFRWLRDGSPIDGATGRTYAIVRADSGHQLDFAVTPVAVAGVSPGTESRSSVAGRFLYTNGHTIDASRAMTFGGRTFTQIGGSDSSWTNALAGGFGAFDAFVVGEGTSVPSASVRSAVNSYVANGGVVIVLGSHGGPESAFLNTVFGYSTVVQAGCISDLSIAGTLQPAAAGTPFAGCPTTMQNSSCTTHFTHGSAPAAAQVMYADATTDVAWVNALGSGTVVWLGWDFYEGVDASTADDHYRVLNAALPRRLGVLIQNSPPLATAVNILGTPKVGQTLSGTYSYSDADADAEGASTFRWLRDGVAISGATSASYTVTGADLGKSITFEVTPKAATGVATGTAMVSGGVTIVNSAPVAAAVTVTGTPNVGQSLTGAYSYFDADGDSQGATSFRWLRGGIAISGTNSTSYTITLADLGKTITFEVTPVAATGASPGTPVASSGVTIVNSAPVASNVTITGTPKAGQTLTGSYTYADADGDPQGATTFRWLHVDGAISGATGSTYAVTAADVGKTISFEVTPVAAAGVPTGLPVTSSAVTVLNSAPVAGNVSITGTPKVGQILTGTYAYSDVDTDVEGTSTFRWLSDGSPISGATASSYTVTTADLGKSLTFEVTPAAATGATPGLAATSSGVTILNSAPLATAVLITGTPKVGQSLTGTYTYTDADTDAEGTSTFRWLRDGTAIPGATTKRYTVVLADLATSISFEVTPVAAAGTITGAPVASTGVTIVNSAPLASSVAISGSPRTGQTLSGTYAYSDADGDTESTSTFRWLRDGAPISGAVTTTYTVAAADIGKAISFEVTPKAAAGASPGAPATSAAVAVTNSPPTASHLTVNGTSRVSQLLTGSYTYTDVDGDAEGATTFRWLRDGSPIPGATGTSYSIGRADTGRTLTFEVTPAAATGTSPGIPVTSAGIAVANSTPTATSFPIAGTPAVGQTLTGSYGYDDVDGDGEGASTFRWLRGGSAIPGATSSTYATTLADLGKQIVFEVTPVASTGASPGASAVSAALTILNSPPAATNVAVTGAPQVGQTLAGAYIYSDVDGDLEGVSRFRWLRDGTAITGAIARAYSVTQADLGRSITFEVTPVAASGNPSGAPATGAGIAIINSAPVASTVTITGVPNVGQTLTGHYIYSDVDGDLESSSTLQWLSDGVPLGNATASTYTATGSDLGHTLTFKVTPAAASGATPGSAATSAGITIVQPPALTSLSPIGGVNSDTTSVTLTGARFLAGATARLNDASSTALSNVTVVTQGLITAQIPAGVSPGTYDVIVTTTSGQSATGTGSKFTLYAKAVLTSPVPGTTLTGASATFQWTTGAGATEYWLQAGSSLGGSQDFSTSTGTATSQAVTTLPVDGSLVYVRLWTKFDGIGWVSNDYTFRAFSQPKVAATLTSPAVNSTLAGSTATFQWDTGSGAAEYQLQAGSSLGGAQYFSASTGLSRSQQVTTLPTNGSVVYVRLWTRFPVTGWASNDYTFTAFTQATVKATLLSPAPGTTLTGSTVTFQWDTGAGAAEYWLQLGSSLGGAQYFSQSTALGRSAVVTTLPTNGTTVYARLWTRFPSTGWVANDYRYTSSNH